MHLSFHSGKGKNLRNIRRKLMGLVINGRVTKKGRRRTPWLRLRDLEKAEFTSQKQSALSCWVENRAGEKPLG